MQQRARNARSPNYEAQRHPGGGLCGARWAQSGANAGRRIHRDADHVAEPAGAFAGSGRYVMRQQQMNISSVIENERHPPRCLTKGQEEAQDGRTR